MISVNKIFNSKVVFYTLFVGFLLSLSTISAVSSPSIDSLSITNLQGATHTTGESENYYTFNSEDGIQFEYTVSLDGTPSEFFPIGTIFELKIADLSINEDTTTEENEIEISSSVNSPDISSLETGVNHDLTVTAKDGEGNQIGNVYTHEDKIRIETQEPEVPAEQEGVASTEDDADVETQEPVPTTPPQEEDAEEKTSDTAETEPVVEEEEEEEEETPDPTETEEEEEEKPQEPSETEGEDDEKTPETPEPVATEVVVEDPKTARTSHAIIPAFGYTDAGQISANHKANINDTNAGISGEGIRNNSKFGSAVANLGDLDGAGDGVKTIAVGSPGDGVAGAVFIMNLNADGTVRGTPVKLSNGTNGIDIVAGDNFGISVANLGDLDIGLSGTDATNSKTTIAVGVNGDEGDGTNRGAIYLLNLTSSGQLVGSGSVSNRAVKISDDTDGLDIFNGDYFGTSVESLGDLDGTGGGMVTLAVGADGDDVFGGDTAVGSVYIININSDGSIRGTQGKITHGSRGITLAANDNFGSSIENLGDLDGTGSGVTTIAVGATGADAVYIININSTGGIVAAPAPAPVKISNSSTGVSITSGDSFGASVVGLGDIDGGGDGFTAIAVGASGGEKVYIIKIDSTGTVIGTAGTINATVLGTTIEDTDLFGSALANIGDLDGDGIDEIIIGEAAEDTEGTDRGEIHIVSFTGNQYYFTDLDTVDITLPAVDTGEPAPTYAATLPAGLSFDSSTRRITGSPTATSLATPYTLTATNATGSDTYTFNIETFIAVAPEFGYGDAGLIAVNHFSSINRLTDGLELVVAVEDGFGTVVDLGDIDGSGTGGVTTIAVGAGGDKGGGTNRGAVHLIKLNADGTIDAAAKIANGTRGITLGNDSFFGSSVANLGDLDGSGTGGAVTLAIGVPGADSIYLFNINSDLTLAANPVEINNATDGITIADDEGFGSSIANLGDLDGGGDGATTIAVGAFNNDTGGDNAGKVYIINITSAGVIESTAEIDSGDITSLAEGDQFGRSIADLGDLDGTGAGARTIAVGAGGDNDLGTSNTGAVYIINIDANGSVLGTSELKNSTPGITLVNNESFGYSIENLGDMDGAGEGVTTIAVGTQQEERVHIINIDSLGAVIGRVGLINSASLGITIDNRDLFGSSIAKIGDINGDGIDEIIIGESDADPGVGEDAGEIHIISFTEKQYSFAFSDTADITLPAVDTGSAPITYELSPTLSNGLTFDDATRTITDSPTSASASIEYTLTARNRAGTSTFTFNLETVEPEAPDFGYADAGLIAVNHFAKLNNSNQELNLNTDDVFGRSVTNLGDIDGAGEGVTAIAVGAPNDGSDGSFRGAVYIVNINSRGGIVGTPTKLDGRHTKLDSHICTNSYGFGFSVESLGDLDIGLDGANVTDSKVTIAVGATGGDGGNCGNSFINSGAVFLINLDSAGDIVGSVVKLDNQTTGISLSNGDAFGASVANLGDLDGDGTGGVTAIAVGVSGVDTGGSAYSTAASSIGAIHILNLNSAGALVGSRAVLTDTDLELTLVGQGFLGRSVEGLGDLDIGLSSETDRTNSVVTIAAGAPSNVLRHDFGPEQVGGYPNDGGSVFLVNLDVSGARVGEALKIGDDTPGLSINHGEGFGSSILNLGDIDGTGDGEVTVAIGSAGIDAVHIINFDGNGAILGHVGVINDSNISDTLTRFDSFGVSLANIGDINGDGIDEIAVGETITDGSRGTLHIISAAKKNHSLTTSNAVNIYLPKAEKNYPASEYTFSPGLPTGLTFNDIARTITGTPTTDTAGKDYTLTATNTEGEDTFSFRLGVGDLAPALSSDNELSDIEISSWTSGGTSGSGLGLNWAVPVITSLTLSPTFSSSVETYTVSETIAKDVESLIIITPTTSSSRSTLTINGEDAVGRVVSSQIELSRGDNIIPIVVTAEDGTEKTYTITVEKERNNVATLSDLTVSPGTLSPTFDSAEKAYTISVDDAASSVTVTPTTSDTNASFIITGTASDGSTPLTIASGAVSGLTNGSNTITIATTAEDEETTDSYTITVNKGALAIGIISTDGYVNAVDDDSAVTISGIAQSGTVTVRFSDSEITEKTATVAADGTWSVDIPTAQMTAATEGEITVTATHSVASVVITKVFTYDATAPAVPTLELAEDTGSDTSDGITNNPTVTVAGLESNQEWEYKEGTDAWGPGTGTTFTLTTQGALGYRVRQTDVAGNRSTDSAATSFTLDTDAPTVTTPIPDQTTVVGTGLSFQIPPATFTETGLTYSSTGQSNGITFATDTWTGTTTEKGTVVIILTAEDLAGNTVTDTFNITIAGVSIAISEVSGGYVNDEEDESAVTISGTSTNIAGSQTIDLTITDSGSGSVTATASVTAASSGDTWTTTISSADMKTLVEGIITVEATYTGADPTTPRTFTYDTTAPTIVSGEARSKSRITLTSSETLAGTATASDFSASYGSTTTATPESVSVNGNAITISVDTSIVIGDTITATYTGATLTDVAGNALAVFADQAVENNIRSGGGGGGVQSLRKDTHLARVSPFLQGISQLTEREKLIQEIKAKIEELQRRIEEILVERELAAKEVPPVEIDPRQKILNQIEEVQRRIEAIRHLSAPGVYNLNTQQ